MSQRQLVFIGSSQDDPRSFPEDVKDVVGYALWRAQIGEKHPSAKPLRGFGGAGVIEISDEHSGDAYRVVYSVWLTGVVYVLHAFKKKSTRGIATPRQHFDMVKKRLKDAADIHTKRSTS
jgi:phage-related protein